MPLLKINNLVTCYDGKDGKSVPAVNGLSLDVYSGTVVGLLGESGCGKTATAKSIMRLQQPARIIDGEIIYNERNLLKLSDREIRKLRGGEIAFVFQDASMALNPVFRVGQQITDVISAHQSSLTKKQLLEKLVDLLDKVELAHYVKDAYPHELSGGMKQRVVLAMALAATPKLIIADEPTTGLDAGIAKAILDLFRKIKTEDNLTMLFITHDVNAAAYLCDDIALMYKGKIVEKADKASFFENSIHPYSVDLLNCMPKRYNKKAKIDAVSSEKVVENGETVACNYYWRCRHRQDICIQEQPICQQINTNHWARCWNKE